MSSSPREQHRACRNLFSFLSPLGVEQVCVVCVCLCARGSPCVVADCLTYPFNVSRAIIIIIMDKSVGWV